jgi:hypothetical protein
VNVADRLPVPEGDVAVRAREVAVIGEGDALSDLERPRALDANGDFGFRELERLRLRGCRDRQGRERGDQNCTRGASRTGSSISKNGFSSNENMDATRFVGTVSRAFS